MRLMRTAAIAAATLAITAGQALADEFPSQPVEVVTHASAGGGTDTTARTMLIRARRELGTDAFVQIKKGGGGTVAMSYVSGKPADGHTVMAITPTHLITMARGRAPIKVEDIKGVGPRTRTKLYTALGSLDAIRKASLEELVAAGATRRQAMAIRRVYGEVDEAEGQAVDNAFK